MRWSNLFIIFRREVRDQIRDRRTLFMIFVLPILLYPILGIGVIKFAAALEQKPRVVVVVGAEYLPEVAAALESERRRLQSGALRFARPRPSGWSCGRNRRRAPGATRACASRRSATGEASAVMVIPPDLPEQLQRENEIEIIPIQYNSVDEPSQITYLRLKELVAAGGRASSTAGSSATRRRRATPSRSRSRPRTWRPRSEVGGSVWSRLFPFLLVMMSLTGAFYPAIDLCAGEKERGTMETLLISPASRSEIVLGKFLTVMLASVMTAILNLLEHGTDRHPARPPGRGLLGRGGPAVGAAASVIAPPTLQAAFWMILLLIPLAAFFSAVCVSLAVLARSMKEGQYYMTPLYLVCMPLDLPDADARASSSTCFTAWSRSRGSPCSCGP